MALVYHLTGSRTGREQHRASTEILFSCRIQHIHSHKTYMMKRDLTPNTQWRF